MPVEYGGWEWQRQQFNAIARENNQLRAEIASLKKAGETNFQGLLQRINEQAEQIEELQSSLAKAREAFQELQRKAKS